MIVVPIVSVCVPEAWTRPAASASAHAIAALIFDVFVIAG
jgi:hypothetical protein